MPVKYNRTPFVSASVNSHPVDDADLADECKKKIDECVARFHAVPVTPASTLKFENELAEISREMARKILERELNRIEPADKKAVPNKIRFRRDTYRVNKRTPARVATRFGAITVWSYYYLNETDGEPGLHPLRLRLGIGAGSATPALLERVSRMSVDHTQSEVCAWLLREYGLTWSHDRLRAALKGFRDALSPFVAELQKARLLMWLEQAEKSRGPHRPVLAVGRDGIMVPMCQGGYNEAGTATVSVYDRTRRRLGTIYLGEMPEHKQLTLSTRLTQLITATLKGWSGKTPRLAYVTDKGQACDEYYHKVLKKMKHPRDGTPLQWEWVLDFYHVCSYIGKIADLLFGADTAESSQWFAKMRQWLKNRKYGVSHVLRSAMQYLDRRKMTKTQTAEFWKAYRYLRRHRRLMDYEGYRRRGLPIGSGVTEAACKTVFTQRFKRSGMRWQAESGQVILDLRTTYLSGIWDATFAADMASRELPQPIRERVDEEKRGSHQARGVVNSQIAA